MHTIESILEILLALANSSAHLDLRLHGLAMLKLPLRTWSLRLLGTWLLN
jgi:hypothetical protein